MKSYLTVFCWLIVSVLFVCFLIFCFKPVFMLVNLRTLKSSEVWSDRHRNVHLDQRGNMIQHQMALGSPWQSCRKPQRHRRSWSSVAGWPPPPCWERCRGAASPPYRTARWHLPQLPAHTTTLWGPASVALELTVVNVWHDWTNNHVYFWLVSDWFNNFKVRIIRWHWCGFTWMKIYHSRSHTNSSCILIETCTWTDSWNLEFSNWLAGSLARRRNLTGDRICRNSHKPTASHVRATPRG